MMQDLSELYLSKVHRAPIDKDSVNRRQTGCMIGQTTCRMSIFLDNIDNMLYTVSARVTLAVTNVHSLYRIWVPDSIVT